MNRIVVVGGLAVAVVLVWAVAAATLGGVPVETARSRLADIREFVDKDKTIKGDHHEKA